MRPLAWCGGGHWLEPGELDNTGWCDRCAPLPLSLCDTCPLLEATTTETVWGHG